MKIRIYNFELTNVSNMYDHIILYGDSFHIFHFSLYSLHKYFEYNIYISR